MSSSTEQLLQCYNISCGQKYREVDNSDESCVYHRGKPYFHDGIKEWTCCKMRSRDFTTFMSFKGCTKGRHSNVKPLEDNVADNGNNNKSDSNIITFNGNVNKKSSDEKGDGGGGKNGENDEKDNVDQSPPFVIPPEDQVDIIPIVEATTVTTAPPPKAIVICKNCQAEESQLPDLNAECRYHRGIQVFHDSLKYWSCCPQRKFTEFEDFQKLPPCASAPSHELMVKVECKENWFQTGPTLTIALYGLKGARAIEQKSLATLRGAKYLSVRLVNHLGLSIFEHEWHLRDYVRPEECKVLINVSNVQIVLRKVNEKFHWPSLVEEEKKKVP